MDSENLKGHLLIGTANVLFGISIPIFKYQLSSGVPPEAIAIMRSIFACLMFWGTSLFVPKEKVATKDLIKLVVCGLCGVGINQYLFVIGLKYTSPIDASIISTTVPIFVLLLAAIILKEAITMKTSVGVIIGLSGGLLLVLSSASISSNSGCIMGDLLQVINCLLYSVYLVMSKQLSSRYSSVTMMKWMFLFSSLIMAPLCIEYVPDVPTFHAETFCFVQFDGIIYLLLGATYIPFMLIPMSLKRIRPTVVSMYIYLQPIIASFAAITMGQDTFSLLKLISALLVFVGVYLVTQSKNKHIAEIKP